MQAAKDLVDLSRDDQRRQVQHHADADAGADVRGTGRQEAEPRMEREIDLLGNQVVDLVNVLPGVDQVQAAVHHLDPQMIFLIDHQADLLVTVDGHAAGPFAIGVFAAD